ncbi:polyprenyl synthetase family protein [Oricola thermophila]|uniref:Probable farnesyl diphosphate synthase n=1 Tax=Oricola thermophila TaxID=2742145 RepID=A0A6N1VLM4_9HYPH|nr:farnesyl diphosphate synthase [Oricola thermophila]QKV19847.1 polyprenyl synthetase family protein [Oricola thermophila]
MLETAFSRALSARAGQVEAYLDRVLGSTALEGEIVRPEHLMAAIRHGVLNGGKRFRPFLVMETARLFGADEARSLPVAAALECVHCYSLIHDDLPAMDDDDMRRGLPTVHRAFDEATAILAGDSLLTFAFDLVTDPTNGLGGDVRADLARRLARAAGLGGMAGGQALDLAAPGMKPDERGIVTLQSMKTGALIRFACEAGAVIGGAGQAELARMRDFGEVIGRAFQLADDLLDVTQTADAMGKATGKDAVAGKATLVSLHGQDWARGELSRLVGEADALLAPFGSAGETLVAAAHFVAERQS